MLSGPPPASPYASSTPLDIADALAGLVTPLLGGPGGFDAAIDIVLGGLQLAILNYDQRGHRTWHALRPSRTTDGRALAVLPCWSGRPAWLLAVGLLLDSEHGQQVRRRHHVSRSAVIDYARVCAGFAESTTGRHMTAALSTIADRAGLSSVNQAERARRVITALGLHVQVSAGRHLTGIEIMAAHAHHGGHQRAVASEYALIMPAEAVALVHTTTPSAPAVLSSPTDHPAAEQTSTESDPGAARAPLSPVGDISNLSSLDARESLKETPSKKHVHGGRTRRARTPRRTQPRPLALQRLAGQLVARMQGIDKHGQHLGRVCDVLDACGVDPTRWSAVEVRAQLDNDAKKSALNWPDTLTDPIAYLAWRLRRIDWTQPTPTELKRTAGAAIRPRVVIDDCDPAPHTTPAETVPTTTAASARAAIADILSRTTTRPTSANNTQQKEKTAMTSTITTPAATVTVYSAPGCGQFPV